MPDKAVNKVIYGNDVLMDITDTTAQASDVVQGKDFYGADGIKTSGTAVIPTKTSDLTNDSGFITGMTILSYGSSTWQDFLDAYNANKVVYCRASSNSNPASGSQTRLAFMAYVSNATNPTNVEFQYYRSMSSHSATQQGDEVYVYKLTNTGTWTVTVRKTSPNIVAGTGLSRSYSNDTVTLSFDGTIPTKTSDLTNDSGFITTETDPTVPSWAKASTKPSYTASEVGALPDDTDIPSKISDLMNDQVYDLGVKTENDGYILLEGSEAEDILAMWNRGMCALVVTVSGRTYVAFKEQVITFRGLPLYSFVGTWSGLNENGRPVSSKVALALSYFEYDPSYIMFALIPDVMSINGIGVDNNNEITLDASDVGALPDDTVIPSKTSDLTNDSGFITTETDPTVPSWAKASTKPSYTASEVGAVATSAVGAANGVVPLNASSKIDETYLPSYVDDVIEGYFYNGSFYKESSHTTVITGEAGKIYVDLTTDKTYRYGGSTFVEISSGTTVSVSRDLTTGTKVATITVNGTGSDIYAPMPPTKVSDLTNDSGFYYCTWIYTV